MILVCSTLLCEQRSEFSVTIAASLIGHGCLLLQAESVLLYPWINMVMSELVRQLGQMKEIWEIIPSQSGHRSWLSQVFPSLTAHMHTFVHTHMPSSELHAGARRKSDTWKGIDRNKKKCIGVFNQGFRNLSKAPFMYKHMLQFHLVCRLFKLRDWRTSQRLEYVVHLY